MHGQWSGALLVDGEHITGCDQPEVAREVHQLRDLLVRIDDPVGGGTGFGNIETMAIGAFPELGLPRGVVPVSERPMAGLSQQQRDLDAIGTGFVRWYRHQRRPEATDVMLSPLRTNPSSGFSSETLLFELSWMEGATTVEASVLRLPPGRRRALPDLRPCAAGGDAEPARSRGRADRGACDPRTRRELDRHRLPAHAARRRSHPKRLLPVQGLAQGRRRRRAARVLRVLRRRTARAAPRRGRRGGGRPPESDRPASACRPRSPGGPTTSRGPRRTNPTQSWPTRTSGRAQLRHRAAMP